jgi:hypothetical protein
MKASHNPRVAAAAIALGAAVTVTLQDGIKQCCTRAHAQTQTASPDPANWDHNGSVMYLVKNGSSREFHYQKPRPGMLEAGARPGSLLFRGQFDNGQYFGTAYIFNPHCGQIPFQVKGPVRRRQIPSQFVSRLDTAVRTAKNSMVWCRMGRHYMPLISKEFLVTSG